MKFGYLIVRKICKFVITRCPILRLKCSKFDFDWGSTPDHAAEAYSAHQIPYLDFRGLLLKEREAVGNGKGKGRGRGRE